MRELAALIALPVVLAVLFVAPAPLFLGLVAAVGAGAAAELAAMAKAKGYSIPPILAALLAAAIAISTWVWGLTGAAAGAIAVCIAVPTLSLFSKGTEGSMARCGTLLLGALYVGLLSGAVGWLRILPETSGPKVTFFFLAVIWIGDSAAYYLGTAMGKHKLAPKISPKKTWEGLIAGMTASVVAAVAAQKVFFPSYELAKLAGAGVILALAAPLGDLVESQWKRDAGIKDSGNFLPGHGGFLDRTDSLLYSAPILVAYFQIVGWPS